MVLHETHQEVADFGLAGLVLQRSVRRGDGVALFVDADHKRLDVLHRRRQFPKRRPEGKHHENRACEG
jgi:hypothetical protein